MTRHHAESFCFGSMFYLLALSLGSSTAQEPQPAVQVLRGEIELPDGIQAKFLVRTLSLLTIAHESGEPFYAFTGWVESPGEVTWLPMEVTSNEVIQLGLTSGVPDRSEKPVPTEVGMVEEFNADKWRFGIRVVEVEPAPLTIRQQPFDFKLRPSEFINRDFRSGNGTCCSEWKGWKVCGAAVGIGDQRCETEAILDL